MMEKVEEILNVYHMAFLFCLVTGLFFFVPGTVFVVSYFQFREIRKGCGKSFRAGHAQRKEGGAWQENIRKRQSLWP